MKKLMALLLAMVMLLALTGCGSEEELAAKQAEVERLEAKLAALENAPAVNKIHAVNATVNGKTVVEDTKSSATKTKDYILKRKMMLYFHGIKIKEI
mgnify:CR=1 FL=1